MASPSIAPVQTNVIRQHIPKAPKKADLKNRSPRQIAEQIEHNRSWLCVCLTVLAKAPGRESGKFTTAKIIRALRAFLGANPYTWARREVIAERAGVGERTVSRKLAWLERQGLLVRESTIYRGGNGIPRLHPTIPARHRDLIAEELPKEALIFFAGDTPEVARPPRANLARQKGVQEKELKNPHSSNTNTSNVCAQAGARCAAAAQRVGEVVGEKGRAANLSPETKPEVKAKASAKVQTAKAPEKKPVEVPAKARELANVWRSVVLPWLLALRPKLRWDGARGNEPNYALASGYSEAVQMTALAVMVERIVEICKQRESLRSPAGLYRVLLAAVQRGEHSSLRADADHVRKLTRGYVLHRRRSLVSPELAEKMGREAEARRSGSSEASEKPAPEPEVRPATWSPPPTPTIEDAEGKSARFVSLLASCSGLRSYRAVLDLLVEFGASRERLERVFGGFLGSTVSERHVRNWLTMQASRLGLRVQGGVL